MGEVKGDGGDAEVRTGSYFFDDLPPGDAQLDEDEDLLTTTTPS
jgi:hypothetical protein